MPSDQTTPIPRVPIQTPMWDGPAMKDLGQLTRTWVIFFEKRFGGNSSSAGNGGKDVATFGFGILYDVQVASDVCPRYVVRRRCQLIDFEIVAKVPPTGSSMIVDVVREKADGTNAGTMFTSTKLVIPAGSFATIRNSALVTANQVWEEDDRIKINVIQRGSTIPGRIVTVVGKFKLL